MPVAVDETGGFENFRETATKTNSLIDRLKAIELPDVDDVADDLENYLKTKERAEELNAEIEQTDQLIDEIVYELYGLTTRRSISSKKQCKVRIAVTTQNPFLTPSY